MLAALLLNLDTGGTGLARGLPSAAYLRRQQEKRERHARILREDQELVEFIKDIVEQGFLE